jgi:hypothetical protein
MLAIREKRSGQSARGIATAQPSRRRSSGRKDSYAVTVALEIDLRARHHAKLVAKGFGDHDLALGPDTLSHTRSITSRDTALCPKNKRLGGERGMIAPCSA